LHFRVLLQYCFYFAPKRVWREGREKWGKELRGKENFIEIIEGNKR
jgi:hypothetical protein